ncbi:MAG: cupin domain-containing protein [Patescibacteria group bacterium]|nr:cupin domain-containing protein [Patescibacteria group bacterium]
MNINENIIKLAKQNDFFRKVIKTGEYSQIVLMSLFPGEDIGNEVHENVDQILVFVEGNGKAKISEKEFEISESAIVFVDAGVWHNFTNTGSAPLKLYTIYSPPNHPIDKIQKAKPNTEEE